MTRTIRTILLLAALGLSAAPALAAFENVDVSPRHRAMGDTGVAITDGAFAPYFNPAGLAIGTGPSVGWSFVRPYGVDFADLLYLGAAIPLPGTSDALGFGVRRFAVEYQGIDLMSEMTYTLSYGRTLYSDLHSTVRFGLSGNLYALEFGPTVGADGEGTDGFDPGSDAVVGIDTGLLVTLHERTRLGVLVKNVNNPKIGIDDEEIRQRVHAGIAYEPYLGVVTTFEFENVLGEEVMYHGGLEMEVAPGFDLRFGTMNRPSKMTAGFGYELRGLRLDYGYSTGGGTLDGSHQFGLTYSWGGEAP
jgi:hypothetical protein